MNKYFEEKTPQVSPSTFEAFGITINSRYGDSDEIIRMINFARGLAEIDIHGSVKEVFYDSKSTICFIKTFQNATTSQVSDKIQEVGKKYFVQFDLDGEHYMSYEDDN